MLFFDRDTSISVTMGDSKSILGALCEIMYPNIP